MSTSRIFTVDKFLGLNESEDGSTELKLGEATNIRNFTITDGGNLKTRPGVALQQRFEDGQILCFWRGRIGQHPYLVTVWADAENNCRIKAGMTDYPVFQIETLNFDTSAPVKAIPFGDRLYVCGKPTSGKPEDSLVTVYLDDSIELIHLSEPGYIPLAITESTPAGAGTTLEPLNILSSQMRVQFSADGTATNYVLPEIVQSVASVTVDNKTASGSYATDAHTFTFAEAPANGVCNVEFLCNILDADLTAAASKFYAMPYSEAFNGATDTRLFFYGDGTNICYYTGAPSDGTGFYLPAGNEIAVDATASAITAMCRDYSRLIAFKPDSAFSITYEPTTLDDGKVIAGFTVRPVHKELGCDVPGQVQLVNNSPRTICRKGIYDWKIASYSYRDERYAKKVSDRVEKILAKTDLSKAVACDNTAEKAYYLFLNDEEGTVLVHRYELDVWTVYCGEAFKDIRFANTDAAGMLFASNHTIYFLDPERTYDVATTIDGEDTAIQAVWESGYMSFGAPFRRKYSGTIWISILPQVASNMDITVSTDTREEYRQKNTGLNLFSWDRMDFSDFAFSLSCAPKIKRIRLKVKKFVYYKMIFRVSKPGARVTVLGYDQQVRFSSFAK